MDNELNNNFLEEKSTSLPGRVKDLFLFALMNVHWFILCAAVGAAIGYVYGRKLPFTYASNARILLKMSGVNRNGSIPRESSIMNGIAQSYFYSPFTTTINNEIMIIRSKGNLREVIRRHDFNVQYTSVSKLAKRPVDFYGSCPFAVDFLDLGENEYAKFDCQLKPDSLVTIMTSGYSAITGKLGQELATPFGRVMVLPTLYYGDGAFDGMPITVTHIPLDSSADSYRNSMSVSRDDDANTLLNLSITDYSAKRAADFLNAVISYYNEDSMRDKTQIIENTYDFINQRIAQLDRDLGVKEGQLASFKRANSIIDVGALGEASLAKKALHSQEASHLAQQITLARQIQTTVESSEEGTPLMVAIEDGTISSEVAKYNESVIKINKYHESGSDENPMVKSLASELEITRGNILTMLSSYIQNTTERLNEVRVAEEAADADLKAVPEKQIYVSDLERFSEVKSALYLNLLGKREELLISQPAIEAASRVIDEARVFSYPVSPDTTKIVLLGLLLGFLAPAVVFLIYKIFDTSVKYRKDIESSTTVPFIGEVPFKSRTDGRNIVVEDGSRDVISESFRLLRSNLMFMKAPDSSSTVYMMCSMTEGSGKTFVSSNLAAAFAIAGKSVIVVDIDLRKGSMTRVIAGRRGVRGVSEYLVGKVDEIDRIIHKDAVAPGADLVPSGAVPPNPAELLFSSRLDKLIEELRSRYEYIFIDCVPSNVVADSDIVKRVADATVFVVRSGHFDKRGLPGLQYMYTSQKYPNMGLVLNGIVIRKDTRRLYGYGYGYGYGTGYGYGYGYGYGKRSGNTLYVSSEYGYGCGYGHSNAGESKEKKSQEKEVSGWKAFIQKFLRTDNKK